MSEPPLHDDLQDAAVRVVCAICRRAFDMTDPQPVCAECRRQQEARR